MKKLAIDGGCNPIVLKGIRTESDIRDALYNSGAIFNAFATRIVREY